jgi:hypothetical protein
MWPWRRERRQGPRSDQDALYAGSTPDPVPGVNTYVARPSTALGPVLGPLAGAHRCDGCSGSEPALVGYANPDGSGAGNWSELEAIDATDEDPCPICGGDHDRITPADCPWSELAAMDRLDPILARALDGDR